MRALLFALVLAGCARPQQIALDQPTRDPSALVQHDCTLGYHREPIFDGQAPFTCEPDVAARP